jgi:hypothetical protein
MSKKNVIVYRLIELLFVLLNQNINHNNNGNKAKKRFRDDADQRVSSINTGAVENAKQVTNAKAKSFFTFRAMTYEPSIPKIARIKPHIRIVYSMEILEIWEEIDKTIGAPLGYDMGYNPNKDKG